MKKKWKIDFYTVFITITITIIIKSYNIHIYIPFYDKNKIDQKFSSLLSLQKENI